MLEMVDLKKKLPREEFKEKMDLLERRINELQRDMKDAGIPTILVFEGLEAAGKGTCINRLMLPLDPRGFKVHPIHPPTLEESMRPFLVRFWHKLPNRGRVAIFDHSWYRRVLEDRVEKIVPKKTWKSAFEEILAFERQQTDDGAVIMKFWLHIGKKEQAKRFVKIEKNPALSWKVGKMEWKQQQQYRKYLKAAEETFERTNTAQAPWIIVEAHDKRFAQVKIFETVIKSWENALEARRARKAAALDETAVEPLTGTTVAAPASPKTAELVAKNVTILSGLDLTQTLEREEYDREIDGLQDRLRELEHALYVRRIPVIVAFEGCDAAGKGGAIKRLTENMDPRGFEAIPIAAPSKEELDHHYLWRFALALPKAGHLTIFDRTWYGRVLVERIEGFCSTEAWQRAYREINEFEAHLCNFGTVLVKFWLHIDQDEQLRRFKERQETTWKQWKITEEDWRNREKWPSYEVAVNDMLLNCSTSYAPWTIVEANDKLFSRTKVLKTVIAAIEKKL
jgi:polyphosphate kinase 2 (PPK2 family)